MMKPNRPVFFLCRSAMAAALYVVLTMVSAAFGLCSGPIQFRLSEMLCVLPALWPESAVALFLGCLISNLITGSAVYDILFGSIATLLGALGTLALRRTRNSWLIALPPLLSNLLILPPVLMASAGMPLSWLSYLPVAGGILLGEGVCCLICGSFLYRALIKHPALYSL